MAARGIARLDDRGRLVLPVEVRRRLGLRPGDELRISEEADGGLRLETRLAAARTLIGAAGDPLETPSLDALRAERQLQAAAEERDALWVASRQQSGEPPRVTQDDAG